jgi:prepilin signal peptidase PulO-like enzyme (type II secretory pathway)
MILIASLLGLIVGWFILWLSSRLPALSTGQTSPFVSTPKDLSEIARFRSHTKIKRFDWLPLMVLSLTAVLYTYLWHLLQFSGNFFFLATLCAFLILIAVIDLKYQLILNILIVPATGIMLLYQFVPTTQASWYALLGGLIAFLLFLFVGLVSPGGLGGGDIKLAAFLGVTFGLPYLFWALLAGVLTGGATAVFLLLVRKWKAKTHIPYGPFLCLGAIVALLVNPVPWLLSLFT